MDEIAVKFGQLAYSLYTPIPLGLDADATAWAAQVATNGGAVSGARQILISNLIACLKAGGIWTKLTRLWIHAAEDQPGGLTDLKGLSLATAVNGPTFTADRGFTAATTGPKYINTNYNPNALSINDCHVSSWVYNLGTANGMAAVGVSQGGFEFTIIAQQASNRWAGVIGGAIPVTTLIGLGHVLTYRNGSGAGGSHCLLNGGLKAPAATSSGSMPNANLFILAENNTITPAVAIVDGSMVSATSAGTAMTDAEAAAFYACLKTYMVAVGVVAYTGPGDVVP